MSGTLQETERYSSENLGDVLRQQGRKARWLAGQIGVSESLISMVISGSRTLGREHAERVADILGEPFFVLFKIHERNEFVLTVESETSNAAD